MILVPPKPTLRWTDLFYHEEQQRYFHSRKRFNIAHAGRRGGKTDIAKRKLINRAYLFPLDDGRFVFGGPTHKQASDIFWNDLLKMVPLWALFNGRASISRGERHIKLKNGATIQVAGLDEPARIEGTPLDGFVGDEFGNFKPEVWAEHLRPALDTLNRPGWADLVGVPEGLNHYFNLVEEAAKEEKRDYWGVFLRGIQMKLSLKLLNKHEAIWMRLHIIRNVVGCSYRFVDVHTTLSIKI